MKLLRFLLPAVVLLAALPLAAQTQRGYLNNVPESQCYALVYSLDIPDSANYAASEPSYAIDNRGRVSDFDRVAYYL